MYVQRRTLTDSYYMHVGVLHAWKRNADVFIWVDNVPFINHCRFMEVLMYGSQCEWYQPCKWQRSVTEVPFNSDSIYFYCCHHCGTFTVSCWKGSVFHGRFRRKPYCISTTGDVSNRKGILCEDGLRIYNWKYLDFRKVTSRWILGRNRLFNLVGNCRKNKWSKWKHEGIHFIFSNAFLLLWVLI